MSYLYINSSGYEVHSHSYSGGADFDFCPRWYETKRVLGYKEKGESAAMAFGNVIEAAITYFHNNPYPGNSRDEFVLQWAKFKEVELEYSDTEGDWKQLGEIGQDLLRLYEVLLPTLPIVNPKFQLNYRKSVFTDPDLAAIKHSSYIDCLSLPPGDHPLLPAIRELPPTVRNPAGAIEGERPLIIDIKTSGKFYPAMKGLIRLDAQLREYAWTSGVMDVAFLVLVKRGPSISSGDTVMLLEPALDHEAGSELVALKAQGDSVLVSTVTTFEHYKEEEKAIKGKGSTAKKAELFEEYCAKVPHLLKSQVTKQRIQFLAARMRPEDLIGIGERIGRQITEIRSCSETGVFPQTPGIRFPNAKCLMCKGLGLCLGDKKLVEESLVEPGDGGGFEF